ncbi:MAG TPA: hypothetical protein DCM28_14820 [Phycisphaerales bacterium]|nr:hypothetical protein [Phycisphaerales bacterium]HCD32681.1 hypothetical protein [Phycisphaerales bacterium]|tara:strand:+ start:1318 stop:2661 length:1344 start_codon:yes stop_codon:yes gene_type:complete
MRQIPNRSGWLAIVLVLLVGLTAIAQPTIDTAPSTDDPLISEARLALTSGNVDLGQLLGQLLDWLGIQSQMVRRRCADMKIPVTGAIGELKLETLGELTRGVVTFKVDDDQLVLRVNNAELRRQDKTIRSSFREKMAQWFPDLASQAYDQYGLWSLRPQGVLAPLPKSFQMDRVVVLVHGLDEPGDIWDELIVELQQAGHTPLVFVYPNDQPITDSAKLFTQHLVKLSATGMTSISIVAHSMGGLVSREMLSDPKMTGYPKVQRLITVGTPHHGSDLAHFQFVGEMRDQAVRLFSGNGVLFGAVFDGAGEAKIDLLPGSDFLTTLNARPLPEDVTMTCIIGNASPIETDKIRDFEKKCADFFNNNDSEIHQFSDAVQKLSTGIGDGCVSMESAHLEGLSDEVILQANHRSLLRTIPVLSNGKPPAIAIVLDRLSDQLPQMDDQEQDD